MQKIPDLDGLFEKKDTSVVQGMLDEAMFSDVDPESNSSETQKYTAPSNDVEAALKELAG